MNSKLYDMVESDFKDQYSPTDAYWLFSEFKILMDDPCYGLNISLCINIAIEKWKAR